MCEFDDSFGRSTVVKGFYNVNRNRVLEGNKGKWSEIDDV